jgi:hypothetical protein
MKWINLFFVTVIILSTPDLLAQDYSTWDKNQSLNIRHNISLENYNSFVQDTLQSNSDSFPAPKSVLFKSMMIPGWGQIENKQIWKVPIIYGMFAGIGAYTVYLNNNYKDYRAAFYNSNQGEDNDFRFGPTPPSLANVNPNQLQSVRNSFRNRRDFMFVVMGLAYGLNALDAYIFAHMRSFDVSDDLSASAKIGPTILYDGQPGIRVSVRLY